MLRLLNTIASVRAVHDLRVLEAPHQRHLRRVRFGPCQPRMQSAD